MLIERESERLGAAPPPTHFPRGSVPVAAQLSSVQLSTKQGEMEILPLQKIKALHLHGFQPYYNPYLNSGMQS